MKTFTIAMDDKFSETVDELRANLGKSSKADVFKTAIALLKIADEAISEHKKLAVANAEDKVLKEIVLC